MEKKYLRISFISTLLQLFCLFMLGASVYFSIIVIPRLIAKGFSNIGFSGLFIIIMLLSAIVGTIYCELTFLFGIIRLDSKGIYTNGDIYFGRSRLQYPARVDFENISTIDIIPLEKDSKGGVTRLVRPIPYLVIINKQGKKIRFALHGMCKRTVKRMLADLKSNCSKDVSQNLDIDSLTDKFAKAVFAVKE